MGFTKTFLILAVILLLSGCASNAPECPECQAPGSYSECNDQAIKTRTDYRCSQATNFECQSYLEETQCAVEISLSGNIGATVKPSIEAKVRDIIRIEASNVPEDAQIVAYFIDNNKLPPIGLERMPLFASKQGDVWTGMLDTKDYENGLYEIMVLGTTQKTLEGDPQYYARGQILISNN